MKESLFTFQELAISDLHKNINNAHLLMETNNQPQVISFSSPTGSGKTIMMITLIEEILFGSEEVDADPNAVFIWLSDMPELNEQTRLKFESKSNKIPIGNLITIDSSFDSEYLENGNIYFLNTQKLGNDKILTKLSDIRQYTIWETITNTAKKNPKNFYCIIDEAHRGMNLSAKKTKLAQSIMQKFLLGSPDDGLVVMPLVIGISATPQRFQKLLEGTVSTVHKVIVNPDSVKDSGLIKDQIIIHYPEIAIEAEMTMFRSAVQNWLVKQKHWSDYCNKTDEKVNPILVIQVEDGSENSITKTNISECIIILEEALGRTILSEEIVHTFENNSTIKVKDLNISYIDPSRIEDNKKIKFVFFKMNLSTGWDCPRAEVLMSFRSANDYTYIAQLLGRMVRTPLARRITSDMELNNVSLFLPYYDEITVKTVISALQNSEEDLPVDTVTSKETEILKLNMDYYDIYLESKKLITYNIQATKKIDSLRRVIRLARALTQDGISLTVYNEIKDKIISRMEQEIQNIKDRGEFEEIANSVTGVDISALTFDFESNDFANNVDSEKLNLIDFDTKNYFKRAGNILGEALHIEYWKKHSNRDEDEVKIEVIVLANNVKALKSLNNYAEELFNNVYSESKYDISNVVESRINVYNKLISCAEIPIAVQWNIPGTVQYTLDEKCKAYDKHLFIDDSGVFKTYLNSWEEGVVNEELSNGAIAWLRNLDRKSWSLQIPYEKSGEIKPMFPDLIIIRKINENFVFDILEPHDHNRADNCDKAKGLARFAEKHWSLFGRIQLITKLMGPDRIEHFYRLDMSTPTIRNKVKAIDSNSALIELFKEYATIIEEQK